MELSAEIELEKDQEMENYDEICQEDPQLQIIRGKQIEKPEQENNTIEEEMDENKFKLKQQIDSKTLIADETKQYIHMQESKKIMSSSIGKQITKVQETIKQSRRKILEEKNTKHQEGIELHNENSKSLEMKNFTQSTKEIVDELKNYVEIMEQQMSKFKFEELEKKALKKIEESSNSISEKICEINKIKNEISFLISEYKAASGQHKCLLDTKLNNLENELERLKNDTNSLLQTNQQLRHEISRIDEELKEKTDEENESSAKIKEVVESKMKGMEDLKSRSLIKQELEYQRNGLITSIESTTTSIDNLTDDVREIEKEDLALAIQSRNLQEESHISEGDFNLEDKGLNELEEEEKILTEELEELEKQMAILNRENENLIIMDHEETVTLLKEQNSSDSLRRELLDFQNLKNYKQNEIDELKTQMKTIDEDVKRKSDKQDEAKKEQILLKENKEQLEVASENLQQDLIDKKEQFNYKRYTLQVYLENKLNDMRTRLREINENETKEKKKFSEVEAVIKKKKDQYNRLRNTYLMSKTSSSNSKSPLPKIDQDFSRRENEETLEAEQPSFQTSPKSILKSPAKRSAPTTPTKNVKFFGVSSIASSSSSELVNATSQKSEQLRTNLVERKRTFD